MPTLPNPWRGSPRKHLHFGRSPLIGSITHPSRPAELRLIANPLIALLRPGPRHSNKTELKVDLIIGHPNLTAKLHRLIALGPVLIAIIVTALLRPTLPPESPLKASSPGPRSPNLLIVSPSTLRALAPTHPMSIQKALGRGPGLPIYTLRSLRRTPNRATTPLGVIFPT